MLVLLALSVLAYALWELGEDFYKKQRELMTKVVADNDVVIPVPTVCGDYTTTERETRPI